MGKVVVMLNGRSYRMGCQDGEEQRLLELAQHIRGHVDAIAEQFGQIGDDRILMMAGLMLADELWEARDRIAELEGGDPGERADDSPSDDDEKAGGDDQAAA